MRLKKTILIIEGIIAAIAIAAVVVVCLLPEPKRQPDTTDPADQTTEGRASQEGTTEAPENTSSSDPVTGKPTETDTALPTDPATSAPTVPPTEPSVIPPTAPPTEPVPETTLPPAPTSTQPPVDAVDYSRIVFIGDSRTLTMASGGQYEFHLLPDDSVSATWGGTLYDERAVQNVRTALALKRPVMVFWYGINDVQMHPDRDNVDTFIANYDRLLSMTSENPGCTVYVLSILTTTVRERDYYEGQNENIRRYNEALQSYCQAHGYVYVDISALLTGDECFYPGDNIHFSEAWYRERFLPTVLRRTGLMK